MLCKIWGFHGGDYEKWRLLRYGNPVRTSQETHYISVAEPNRLMLLGQTVAVCENLTIRTEVHTVWACVKAGGTYSDYWAAKGS
jgi:hypothetical protein